MDLSPWASPPNWIAKSDQEPHRCKTTHRQADPLSGAGIDGYLALHFGRSTCRRRAVEQGRQSRSVRVSYMTAIWRPSSESHLSKVPRADTRGLERPYVRCMRRTVGLRRPATRSNHDRPLAFGRSPVCSRRLQRRSRALEPDTRNSKPIRKGRTRTRPRK